MFKQVAAFIFFIALNVVATKPVLAIARGCEGISNAELMEACVKATKGDVFAQNKLGLSYANGEGVPQSDTEAVKWFQLAAEQGYAVPQYNLALTYDNGRGVPQNYSEAVKWYQRSAEQGHASAQFNLGVRYSHGQGVIKDMVYAHMWINIAAIGLGEHAIATRNRLEREMTREQITEAQRLARECVRNNLKNC